MTPEKIQVQFQCVVCLSILSGEEDVLRCSECAEEYHVHLTVVDVGLSRNTRGANPTHRMLNVHDL
mgnify:CR=1 FL=1